MKNKVVIIGLDGVDFYLAEDLMKRNIMPNLRKLCEEGARGNMLSCLPLHSSITWTTFITGKNAGKHGIFGFFVMDENTSELKIANSLERKSQTIWHTLNDYGKKVGISNLPSLYPPEKIDGYMICGMLTPSINSNFTYPKSLKDELLKKVFAQAQTLLGALSVEKRIFVLDVHGPIIAHFAQSLEKARPVDLTVAG